MHAFNLTDWWYTCDLIDYHIYIYIYKLLNRTYVLLFGVHIRDLLDKSFCKVTYTMVLNFFTWHISRVSATPLLCHECAVTPSYCVMSARHAQLLCHECPSLPVIVSRVPVTPSYCVTTARQAQLLYHECLSHPVIVVYKNKVVYKLLSGILRSGIKHRAG